MDSVGAYVVSPTVQAVADVVGCLSPGAHPGGLNGQDAYTGQLVVQQPFVKGRRAQTVDDDETWQTGQVAPTLNQFDTGDTRTTVAVVPTLPAIAFSHYSSDLSPADVSPTLRSGTNSSGHAVAQETSVRRLTPRECERLQGFPDDHTRWRADGKEQSDSQRYRQMGNAVTVPVARWIAEQINAALAEEEQ